MAQGTDRGFTLTEILIVVAIVAVVGAIAIPNLLAARLSSNEAAAIATLRTIVSAQAQVQGSGRIDVDNDAIGEYGTIAELTGATGVRRKFVDPTGNRPAGATFQAQGNTLQPSPLSETLSDSMQNTGELVKSGYGFMIFLPDTRPQARWVHETVRIVSRGRRRNRTTVELASLLNETGGPNVIGLDLSESLWCVYARPNKFGTSGRRLFFTSQRGDILQAGNGAEKQQVGAAAIHGGAAFLGSGITSENAVGTQGNDGNVWKISN